MSLHRLAITALCALALLLAWAGQPLAQEDNPSNSRVLVLNSYHQGYHWSDQEMEGALGVLRQAFPGLDPCIEYLDAKRHPEPENLEVTRDYLAAKYRNHPKDLVLALDNVALELILSHRSELFPGAAVVFAGINNFAPRMIAGQDRITGVAEAHDLAGTLELALALHPQTREVLLAHDHTVTGLAMRRDMERVLDRFRHRVEISFTPPATFAQARQMLHLLSSRGLAVILDFATDSQGTSLPLPQGTALLTQGLAIPVYTILGSRLGHGVVGGMLIDGREHGAAAGRLAARVLAGEDPAAMPVEVAGQARPMFDHEVMQRFGIAEHRLPPDSLIINRPVSFYGRHKSVLIASAVLTLFLVAVIVALAVNTMARRRVQAQLLDSEERFRGVFEQAAVGISYSSLDGRFLRANSALCRILGYKPEELKNLTYRDLALPEILPDVEADVGALLAGRIEHYTRERRLKRGDGEPIWVKVTVSMLKDEQGRPQHFLGVLQDISERKAAEHQSARLASIVASSRDSIISLDLEGVITSWNPGAERLYGYSAAQAVGQPVSLIIPPGHPDRDKSYLDLALAGGHGEPYETQRLTKDGRLVEVSLIVSPVLDERGEVRGVSGVARDIGIRKRAQADLKRSEDRYRTLFDTSPFAVFVHVDDRILLVNAAGVALLGARGEEEVLGRRLVDDFIHPEDRDLAHRRRAEILASDRAAAHIQYRLERPDGGIVHVGATGKAVDLDGRPAILTIFWDLTEQKRAEQDKAALESQLEQAQKMEAMGVLAGGIAHDFNNILAAVIGYGELTLELIDQGRWARVEVEQILAAAERARDLVKRILAFSRKSDGHPMPLDLNLEVRQALALLGSTLPKMIRIETLLDPGLAPINADRTQLQQVLLNLATNAADAMPQGGRLTLATANVEVDAQEAARHLGFKPGAYARLSVADSGCGMDQRVAAQIFDPFFTTKEAGKGTGLGLSTVFGIVQAHGGRISCQTQPGQGTVFTLYFPAWDGSAGAVPEQEKPAAAPPPERGRDALILVVDDEDAVRVVMARTLAKEGYRVLQAASGEEAVAICAREAVDLVVLDLSMPGMGGLAALEQIKARQASLPVLVASGYARGGLAEASHKLAQGFLPKPFSRRALAEKVRAMLG